MRKFLTAVATAGLVSLAASAASASVTYSWTESASALNARSGPFAPGADAPFTFDFTVASALAASTHYNFGVAGVEAGVSGNVLDFHFSDGSAISSFSLADFPAVPAPFRGGPVAHDESRISIQTDATGAISLFDVLIGGASTANPLDVLSFQLQHTTTSGGTAIVLAAYDYGGASGSYRFTAGDDRCVFACGGSWTSAVTPAGGSLPGGGGSPIGGVPEPATWGLMIVGFGLSGLMARRRRAAGFVRGAAYSWPGVEAPDWG